MSKYVVVLASITLALLVSAGARAQSDNNDRTSSELTVDAATVHACPAGSINIPDTFNSLGEVHSYFLQATGNGALKVSTADCCAFGPDVWRVELHQLIPCTSPLTPAKACKTVPGASKNDSGIVSDYSGTVSKGVQTGKEYEILVSPDQVPGGFAAGMNICITGPVNVL